MKLWRLSCFSLLLCFVFPILSYADQLEDAKAAIHNENFEKGCELLRPLAEENNAEAQFLLGSLYVNGQGVEKDDTKGLSWVMKAALQGYDEARLRALSICLDLANQGDVAAMYNVGYMCLERWGGEQDTDACIGWLESAAKSGHARSAKVLSGIYGKGKFGITPDEEKAAYWSNLPAAFAAGIDGTWSGEVPGMGMGGRPMKLTFTFETDGNTLTGTARVRPGKKIRIRNGKIDGNKFSFAYDDDFGGMEITFMYSGLFLGDELKLSYLSNMGSFSDPGGGVTPLTFTAKRAK
jgi:hypothetical protein